MRRLSHMFAVFCLLLAVTAAAEEAPPEVTVSKYGKVFASPDLTLEIVAISGKKNVLARFTGTPAEEEGIDGRVLDYDAINASTGYDYRGRGKGGVGVNRMAVRNSFGDKYMEAYFQGKTYKLVYDEKASKELQTKTMLADYNAQRGKPLP